MSLSFQKSSARAFIKSPAMARNLTPFAANFVCLAAYWPFNGFGLWGATSGGPPPTVDSWPVLYTVKTKYWSLNNPQSPDTSSMSVSITFQPYFGAVSGTYSAFVNVSTSVGVAPVNSYDLTSLGYSGGSTSWSSSGNDGSYSEELTVLADYSASVASCMSLLDSMTFPPFPVVGPAQYLTPPWTADGNLTLGSAPFSTGVSLINEPGWVGASAYGFPILRNDWSEPVNNIADSFGVNPTGSSGVILCAKSIWRLKQIAITPGGNISWGPSGIWSLWPGVNYVHSELFIHSITLGGTAFVDNGVFLVGSAKGAQVTFAPNLVGGLGEAGFQNSFSGGAPVG